MNITTTNVRSCNSLLENMNIPLYLGQYFCSISEGKNETSFYKLCCQNMSAIDKEKWLLSNLKRIAKYNCFNNTYNMTKENRQHFCKTAQRSGITSQLSPVFKTSLFAYILLSSLVPIGIFANLLIMVTIFRFKKFRITSGYFICNLAFVDLLVIIEMICYLLVTIKLNVDYNPQFYLIFSSLHIFLGSASLLNVTTVTLERAIVIAMPLRHLHILTKKRAKILICSTWLFCIFLFVISLLRIWIRHHDYANTVFYIAVIFSFFIPCIIVSLSYVKIAISAFKSLQIDKRVERSLANLVVLNDGNFNEIKTARPARCREIRLALNVSIMTVPFVFGWGYFMIGNIYEAVNGVQFEDDTVANWFLNTLPFVISSINPITYLIFTKNLRKASRRLLYSYFGKCRLFQHEHITTNPLLTRNSK